MVSQAHDPPPSTGMSAPGQAAPAARQRGFYSEMLDPAAVGRALADEAAATAKPPAAAAPRPPASVPHVSTFRPTPPDEAVLRRRAALGRRAGAGAPAPSDPALGGLEPKVMVPYVQERGKTPRPVMVQRQKRLFALQDVAQLLRDEGVGGAPSEHDALLPLALFDDTDFESRPPEEWAGAAPADGDGGAAERAPVAAKYLSRDAAAQSEEWRACEVRGYDAAARLFVCREHAPAGWAEVRVPRLELLFAAEDPFRFARRVAAAHQARARALSQLRRELYIDAMPADDVAPLEQARLSRILARALPGGGAGRRPGAAALQQEVAADYARAMCAVSFDALAQRAGAPSEPAEAADEPRAVPSLLAGVALPERPSQPPAPLRGTAAIAGYDAPLEHSRVFALATLYSQREAVTALHRVRSECLRVSGLRLYFTGFGRSVRLEEFQSAQDQATLSVAVSLRDAWLPALKNGIRASLKDVGKGWFNLAERDVRVYAVSKLARLLQLVRLMMQDALTTCAQASMLSYAAFLEEAAACEVEVRGVDDVRVRPARAAPGGACAEGAAAGPAEGRAPSVGACGPPLFLLQLAVKDGAIVWRQEPGAFAEAVLAALSKGVDACTGVPQVEKAVMEGLFWSHAPVLAAVGKAEGVFPAVDARLRAALAGSRVPLDALLRTFEAYAPIVALDAQAYLAGWEARADEESHKFSVADLKAAAAEQLAAADAARAKIPAEVQLGLYLVNCAAVGQFVVEKHRELADGLLQAIAARVRAGALALDRAFGGINGTVAKRPRNIEEIAELEAYIETVPEQLAELSGAVEAVQRDHAALDDFCVALPDGDFRQLWAAVAWPKRVEARAHEMLAECALGRQQLQDSMMNEQEAFNKELDSLERLVHSFGQRHTDLGRARDVGVEVHKVLEQLKGCEAKRLLFNSREVLFERPVTDYSHLAKVSGEFEPFASLWLTAASWQSSQAEWHTCPFTRLDPERIRKDVDEATKAMAKACRHFGETPVLGDIARTMREQIASFVPHLPLLEALRNPGMRERHWAQVAALAGKPIVVDEAFTLTKMLAMELEAHEAAIVKACDIAGKEFQIEDSLDTMEREWAGVQLEIVEYRETGTYIMRGFDEVQQQLDDHIVMVQAMAFSPYKEVHAARIAEWEGGLRNMSDIFDEWLKVQRSWMYLEPIFSSDDIQRQLPAEGKRFEKMDVKWRKALGEAFETPHALTVCRKKDLLATYREGNALLDQVQKGLSDYLETKRQGFSRFYFLSNDELLEILSQTKDPRAVQPHLKKCFENIDAIEFTPELEMLGMYSGEKEYIPFDYHAKPGPLFPTGSVEDWMSRVEQTMKATVQHQVFAAAEDYKARPRTDWVKRWPGQIVLAGASIFWSSDTEAALAGGGLPALAEHAKRYHAALMDLTELVRGELTRLQRKSLGALITIDVHGRDVLDDMVLNKVAAPTDFLWISQLRYAIADWAVPDSKALVLQVDCQFDYGNEYLGNTMRLVITPLTDRIYLTLTGALSMMLGGAPAGPAGTGKTETTKDLAKALAKQCVVFNCQEGLDYIAMGKFFKGLAMSGAWACFDEFNRIDVEVLSVIAQQLTTIRSAMLARQARFEFEGADISLDRTNAVFITMNPGYAGRTELPDNLKALFRPVACMVPDYALIGEIRLYSFGYRDARRLSRKMVATFRLSSEQLSSQDHYDFGMRAVNTVIQAAGAMRRDHPEMDEDLLLLRSLADSNRPKFLAEDMALFDGIISDLFPGARLPAPDYGELLPAIEAAIAQLGLQRLDAFVAKCIQLYEVSVLRHGLMLVGPTGGGKSSNKDVMALALSSLEHLDKFAKVRVSQCNPKSITMGQLYGEFDENTHEWTDGILCVLYRDCVKELSEHGREDTQWLVFDGPVDALWIESMNTVLDDNKKLCLVSGEIIAMTPHMNIIFEVEDLAVASPATVSRVGIIYMEPPSCVGTAAQAASWGARQPAAVQPAVPRLLELCGALLDRAFGYVRRDARHYVPPVANNAVDSALRILSRCLADWAALAPAEGESVAPLQTVAPRAFFFALVWGVGGACDGDGRRLFDAWLRKALAADGLEAEAGFAPEGLVYDRVLDMATGSWTRWMETVPAFEPSPAAVLGGITVPTADSVRYTWLVERLLLGKHHVLCVGPTGTGKTCYVKEKLMSGMPDAFAPVLINFSAQTSANQTQDLLDAKLEKRRKGIFAPPSGKYFAVMVDDLNMPKREGYGAQPPIELLRQWMDQSGWYDRKSHEFRKIIDIVFVGCMGPPGGGRQVVTGRFLRHFNLIAFPELEADSIGGILRTIFGTYARGFLPPQLAPLVEPMVAATIEVYATITKELLPMPSKAHYTFNLRDVMAATQGCLSAEHREILRPHDLVGLWAHEHERVYADRLVNEEDSAWYQALVRRVVKERFELDFAELAPDGAQLLFADFAKPGGSAERRPYVKVSDHVQLLGTVEQCLDDYNGANTKKMQLVMFADAVQHVVRIARALRQPGGNALLLGVGGSGRQSLTRLAGFISGMPVFQIEIAKNYGKAEWRADLKRLLLAAGEEGKPTIFLFSDVQIAHESFLEDINNVLNTGDVPNLFDDNEQNGIIAAMRPICAALGAAQTKVAMYQHFVSRVRSNLHLVICMSPIGEVFRARLRNFPSLVNNCTIDWFKPWPDDALREVARATFAPIAELSDGQKAAVVEVAGAVHLSVERASVAMIAEAGRYNYVTPTSYLELLRTFRTLLARKQAELAHAKRGLVVGLDKLATTEVEVAALQAQLTAMQPVLIKTAAEVQVMMGQIQADKASADETRAVVVREEAVTSSKAEECQGIKDSAEKDLALALPALDEAVQCLRDLKLSDISEVAKYSNPPAGVKLVVEAICVIRNVPPKMEAAPDGKGKVANFWEPGKKMLGDAKGLLEAMFQFDKDNIPEKIIGKIDPYISDPNFEPKKIEAVSKSCKAMCQWVRAMHTYHHVAKNVEPKRQALNGAQEELDVLTGNLDRLRATLAEVEDKIAGLEISFAESVAKKDSLQAQVDDATTKTDRAHRLLGGLGGEKVRWQATVRSLTESEASLVGDVLVAAASVAYLGPFTAHYRAGLYAEWRARMAALGLPASEGVTLMTTTLDPLQMRAWLLAGLPSDAMSMENGLILSNARRWPLMVDPQGQANKWAKNMESGRFLEVVKLSDRDLLRTLENAVRFGKQVVLENIGEELDPALEPILLKQTFKQGGTEVMKVGDNTIPYHADFKLYVTTKLANPHYAPETLVKVTLLNFTITQEGLEDQLLGIVVARERPDLEETKNALVVQNAEMARQLKQLEDEILRLLSESSGNILDDEELINTLAKSKVTSDEINVKVAEARATEQLIDATREEYRPCASRAAVLFFCVADMAAVDPMYQYSLPWFLALFGRAIADSEPAEQIEARLANLSEFFTYSLYTNVCRSLFEAHKLLFSFALCVNVLRAQGSVDPSELRFLLSGLAVGGAPEEPDNPAPDWITAQLWASVCALGQLPAYAGFAASFAGALPGWRAYYDDSATHRAEMPAPWGGALSPFQKLLVLRCVRKDKIVPAFQDYIAGQVGARYIEPPTFDLAASYKEATKLVPLLFVLSPGADPIEHVVEFAKEMKMAQSFSSISLGQGQGPIAEKVMRSAMERGAWIMLQNCHLAISWMPRLEAIVEQYDEDTIHKDYRLWLTSMPSRHFPVSILQNSAKMTNEPPTGVKMNLAGAYAPLNDEYLAGCGKVREFKKLLFGVCFFNAVVQDRRKFGPLGFNIRYEFTAADLRCAMQQLGGYLDRYEHVPYRVLEHLTGHVHYGGRITDDWDRRLVMTLLGPIMAEGILDDSYQLAPGDEYRSPPAGSHADYVAAIMRMPLSPHPAVFGLHENADIAYAQSSADAICGTLLSLQAGGSGAKGGSRDDIIAQAVQAIVRMELAPFDLEEVAKAYPLMHSQSMNTVLLQECKRFNTLVNFILQSLQDLRKALKGLVVMSEELELVASSLFLAQIPSTWAAKAYPSLKPLPSWMADLRARLTYIQGWIDNGPPAANWVSALFFPQAFLTGTLQNYARKHVLSIDSISWDFAVIPTPPAELAAPPDEGCYIYGLFIEGARWDPETAALAESRPKVLFEPFPVIWLNPRTDRPAPETGVYICPVYKTLARAGVLSTTGHSTNFVLAVELPSLDSCAGIYSQYAQTFSPHWIKRSVALFCSLSY